MHEKMRTRNKPRHQKVRTGNKPMHQKVRTGNKPMHQKLRTNQSSDENVKCQDIVDIQSGTVFSYLSFRTGNNIFPLGLKCLKSFTMIFSLQTKH
jgi:hypothetical protein